MNGNQGRRTDRVYRYARSSEIKVIGETTRREAVPIASLCIRVIDPCMCELQVQIIAVGEADKDTRLAPGDAFKRLTRIFQGLPGNLKEQALLRIHANGFPRRDPKEVGIKPVALI